MQLELDLQEVKVRVNHRDRSIHIERECLAVLLFLSSAVFISILLKI